MKRCSTLRAIRTLSEFDRIRGQKVEKHIENWSNTLLSHIHRKCCILSIEYRKYIHWAIKKILMQNFPVNVPQWLTDLLRYVHLVIQNIGNTWGRLRPHFQAISLIYPVCHINIIISMYTIMLKKNWEVLL